ncbi:CBS domain-containing protein [Vibrio sp. SS-MA-C1-2]|uniref:CBS domain-containing protein n=1 Tax=Vibrio sp. SS-MA-C1-2 TaxID=2908646 RepID=UPI001F246D1C|nr:CBS domain-containing protein [Vibrio sp. SS-MA-C1-2]UJF20180.1 CBS domain-containing protein [Vibrio sp. SS-MA-C1-2]
MSNREIVRVEDVMQSDVVIINGLITIEEAIKLAKSHQVKALIVDKRHPDDEYGLLLMNDIAKKVLAVDRSPARTNVYEIMSKPALSVSPVMDIRYCARLFERFGISRAPVIKNGEVLGMVSYNSIVINGMTE